MTITTALIIAGLLCWAAHHIGYVRGYWHGREDETNKVADRTARMKRFEEPKI